MGITLFIRTCLYMSVKRGGGLYFAVLVIPTKETISQTDTDGFFIMFCNP